MSLEEEEFTSFLKENEEINSENIKTILKQLTEKLKKSTVLLSFIIIKTLSLPF